MKYILELASRTKVEDTVEQKHLKLVSELKKIAGDWGISEDLNYDIPSFGNHFFAFFKLTKKLGKGIKGDVIYRYRNMLENHHSCDDRIFLEFNSKNVDFSNFINVIFAQYISAFNAYSAMVYPEGLIYTDSDIPFSVKSQLNFRKNIERFYPYQYFDTLFIETCFGLSSGQLYNKLRAAKIDVRNVETGLFIFAHAEFVDTQAALNFNREICLKLDLELPIGLVG